MRKFHCAPSGEPNGTDFEPVYPGFEADNWRNGFLRY